MPFCTATPPRLTTRPRLPRGGGLPRFGLLLALVGLLLGPIACGENVTGLVVHLRALPGVHDDGPNEADPEDLVVTFKSNQDPVKKQTILSPKAGETVFPPVGARTTAFSIVAEGREGPVQVTVSARGPQEHILGVGQGTAMLVSDQLVDTEISLSPTDFQVNTEFPNSQIFTTGPTARQVAADAKGNFVVAWEDKECSGGLGRCDLFARLFDARAKARLNGQRGDKNEFRVNATNSFYDHPAVAMKPDNAFMIAASTNATQSPPYRIVVRSFLADGKPNPAATKEISLSTASQNAVMPDIAALATGAFVVCWPEDAQDQGMTGYKVLCRLVDANGTPLPGASGSNAPFAAATVIPSTVGASAVSVAVAAGAPKGFMVAWSERCAATSDCWNIRGRIYSDTSKAFGALIDISDPLTNKAGSLDIIGLPYGFFVVWTDRVSASAADGTDILGRRIGASGIPLESAFRINTSVAGNQVQPAITALPNANILIAWTTLDETQDPAGGIRGRILLGNGLPVGDDFALNSIDAGAQVAPSLAPVGRDAFLVAFRDDSKLGRDKSNSGIRARLLYPNYSPSENHVGSSCSMNDPATCASGLLCQLVKPPGATNGEERCVNTCKQHGACVNGGRCLKLAGSDQFVCIYQDR